MLHSKVTKIYLTNCEYTRQKTQGKTTAVCVCERERETLV